MSTGVRCPRCGLSVSGQAGCQHLCWTPNRGGLVEFAKSVLYSSPVTKRRGSRPGEIPPAWWQEHRDWLLGQVAFRLDALEGYCFGDLSEIDRLCMDIWHRFAPEPARAGPQPVQ